VLIYHFVGAGWQTAPAGSLDDLQFLFTAARKVETIRDDLGSVGPLIADQVLEAMLGQRRRLDAAAAEQQSPGRTVLRVERELRERLDRLSERLHESRMALGVSPERLQRAVRVGLELARPAGAAAAAGVGSAVRHGLSVDGLDLDGEFAGPVRPRS